MEENSPLWLALREAGRRVLSLGEISIEIPIKHHDRWHRLILNMSDALPQRITFPHISTGENLVVKDTSGRMILTNQEAPTSMETLWLPLKTDIVLLLLNKCARSYFWQDIPDVKDVDLEKTKMNGTKK